MVALGGWGGCELCSHIFNDDRKTGNFVKSVRDFLDEYQLDGFDFDWEYPAINGYPGHQFLLDDKKNFTAVVKKLRETLSRDKIITFAAGGFQNYLENAVEWKELETYIDFVNLMSYDLVGGYSKTTGHQTTLFSPTEKEESVDKAIRFFEKIDFPLQRVVVGATFYTRSWKNVPNINHGLYQPGDFFRFLDYKKGVATLSADSGYVYFWDKKAQATYWYNSKKKIFVTGDDKKSIKAKSNYVKRKKWAV